MCRGGPSRVYEHRGMVGYYFQMYNNVTQMKMRTIPRAEVAKQQYITVFVASTQKRICNVQVHI